MRVHYYFFVLFFVPLSPPKLKRADGGAVQASILPQFMAPQRLNTMNQRVNESTMIDDYGSLIPQTKTTMAFILSAVFTIISLITRIYHFAKK